jgi:hypothetical protein
MNHLGFNVRKEFYRAGTLCLLMVLGGAVGVSGAADAQSGPS